MLHLLKQSREHVELQAVLKLSVIQGIISEVNRILFTQQITTAVHSRPPEKLFTLQKSLHGFLNSNFVHMSKAGESALCTRPGLDSMSFNNEMRCSTLRYVTDII